MGVEIRKYFKEIYSKKREGLVFCLFLSLTLNSIGCSDNNTQEFDTFDIHNGNNETNVNDPQRGSVKYRTHTSNEAAWDIQIMTFANNGQQIRYDTYKEENKEGTLSILITDHAKQTCLMYTAKNGWVSSPYNFCKVFNLFSMTLGQAKYYFETTPTFSSEHNNMLKRFELYEKYGSPMEYPYMLYLVKTSINIGPLGLIKLPETMTIAGKSCDVYLWKDVNGCESKIASWNGLAMSSIHEACDGTMLPAEAATLNVPDSAFSQTLNTSWIE